jgi:hypothetical protein
MRSLLTASYAVAALVVALVPTTGLTAYALQTLGFAAVRPYDPWRSETYNGLWV